MLLLHLKSEPLSSREGLAMLPPLALKCSVFSASSHK